MQNRPFLYGSKVWVKKRFWTGVYSKRLIPNLKALNRKNKKFSLQILVGSESEPDISGLVLNDSTFWCTWPANGPDHTGYGYTCTEFISLGSELPEDFEAESEEDSETSSEDEDSEEFTEKRLRENTEVKQLYISRPGPKLPFYAIFDHAMIKINSNTIYLIGGCSPHKDEYDNDDKKTWIVDPSNNFKIKKGPNLLYDRGTYPLWNRPACAKMELNGKVYIIVAGGMKEHFRNGKIDTSCNTVEILDTSSPDEGWIQGMHIIIHT